MISLKLSTKVCYKLSKLIVEIKEKSINWNNMVDIFCKNMYNNQVYM